MNPTPQFPPSADGAFANGQLGQDLLNRKAALDTTTSSITQAPAGSGKTELLTQRFLALLATVDEPEEIIALTFTNKAAAEMRHRVVSSLQMSALGQRPTEAHKATTFDLGLKVLHRDADRQWHLLEHAGRLQITTIDALCGKLARQMPLMARLGSQPRIATDAAPYYTQAAQATLQALDEGHEAAEAIARVLDHFDNDAGRFQSLIIDMLASRDQWLRHSRTQLDLAAAEEALGFLIQDALQEVLAAVPAAVQSRWMPAARWAASQVLTAQAAGEDVSALEPVACLADWTMPLGAQAEDLPKWRGLASLVLTQSGNPRKSFSAALGFGTAEGKALGQVLKESIEQELTMDTAATLAQVHGLPSPVYSTQEQQRIEDLMTVLKVAHACLWLAFKAAGEVDFIEMAQNALLALGDEEAPSDLQLSLDYRIRHLLVDEFQDTSPTQVDLLLRLTRGWHDGDGRTVFLVGDPMQSIYRFRKADVGLFLQIRQRGLGDLSLKELQLFRNNRSHAEIVEWSNRVFPTVFAAENHHHRGAVTFESAQATKGPHPQAGVSWHPIIDTQVRSAEAEEDELDPADEREAQAVVDIVRQTQREDPNGTIAILVRARSHLNTLVKALRAQQPALPFQAVEIESLAQRQVIQDLLSLTRALLHQGDRVHWLAVLRAPWCGLLLEDLHRLAGDDHHGTVWSLMQDPQRCQGLSPDGQTRLAHVRDVLQEAYAHQGRQRVRRWVEGVWQLLGGPQCLNSPSDLLDSQAFFRTLDEIDAHGTLDLERLSAEVDKLYAAPDPNASARLQIMTVHKSKGLEFDTVILPGLHKKAAPTDKKLLLWDEVIGDDGQARLIVAPLPQGHSPSSPQPSKYALLHQLESARNRHETQRLLYVAVTRTKRHLHLVGCAKINPKPDKGPLKPPAPDSLLSLLWPEARTAFESACGPWLDAGGPFDGAMGLVDIAPAEGMQAHRGTSLPTPRAAATSVAPTEFNHRLVRLARAQRPEVFRRHGTHPTKEPQPTEFQRALADEASHADTLAADIGTLVHKYLEIIARDGLEGWSIDRVRALKLPMERWLRLQGHPRESASRAAEEVMQHLMTTLASDLGRWILGPREQAGCEVPFTTVKDNMIQSHVIDRTFVANGVRWIVDYKTTAPAMEDELDEDHREQLHRYRSLFADEPSVKAVVFYTRTGTLRDAGS